MKRCRVNKTCRHAAAAYWYYVTDAGPVFVTLSTDKPVRYAVPCCAMCAEAIMRVANGK